MRSAALLRPLSDPLPPKQATGPDKPRFARRTPPRGWKGYSLRGQLLRTFLPVAVIAVVVGTVLHTVLISHLPVALSMLITALTSIAQIGRASCRERV